jgi:hypothetical protein
MNKSWFHKKNKANAPNLYEIAAIIRDDGAKKRANRLTLVKVFVSCARFLHASSNAAQRKKANSIYQEKKKKVMEKETDFSYDEDESVKFIHNYLPQELKEKVSDDDIVYFVDLIFEFYESKGFLDGADEDEVAFDEDELVQFVIKNAARDDVGKFTADEITWVVKGELDYCDSIHVFE